MTRTWRGTLPANLVQALGGDPATGGRIRWWIELQSLPFGGLGSTFLVAGADQLRILTHEYLEGFAEVATVKKDQLSGIRTGMTYLGDRLIRLAWDREAQDIVLVLPGVQADRWPELAGWLQEWTRRRIEVESGVVFLENGEFKVDRSLPASSVLSPAFGQLGDDDGIVDARLADAIDPRAGAPSILDSVDLASAMAVGSLESCQIPPMSWEAGPSDAGLPASVGGVPAASDLGIDPGGCSLGAAGSSRDLEAAMDRLEVEVGSSTESFEFDENAPVRITDRRSAPADQPAARARGSDRGAENAVGGGQRPGAARGPKGAAPVKCVRCGIGMPANAPTCPRCGLASKGRSSVDQPVSPGRDDGPARQRAASVPIGRSGAGTPARRGPRLSIDVSDEVRDTDFAPSGGESGESSGCCGCVIWLGIAWLIWTIARILFL